MSVNPSPIGGFAAQFFDNNGVILSGGKIFTYAAGTTTPQATYTSVTGATLHANPIVLDSAGRVPGGEIWLTDGLVYKFVIETATSILIGSYDNIAGVNSNDASLVSYDPPFANSVATNVEAKLAQTISVKDFGAVCDGVTDDSAAVQATINAAPEGTQILLMGSIRLGATINVNKSVHIFGGGSRQGTQVYAPGINAFNVTAAGSKISGFRLYGNRTVGSTGITIDNAAKAIVEEMDIELFGVGIHQRTGGFHVDLNSLRMRNITTKVIWLEDGVGTRLKDVMYDTDLLSYPQPTFGGIHLQQEGTQLELCDFIRAYRGLVIECSASRNIEWVLANNCFFDTCGVKSGGRGVHIINNQPTNYIRGLWFNQVWTATCGMGYLIEGTGIIDGVHLDACPIHNNNNEGIRVDGPLIRNLRIRDCDLVSNNASSVTLPNQNANNVYLNTPWLVQLKDSTLENGYNWNSTPYSQLFLDTNQGDVVVAGNVFGSQVANNILENFSAGAVWFTEPNFGLLTESVGSVSFGAGDTVKTVAHNLDLTPTVNEIQLTPTTGWGSSTTWWVANVTATTFDVQVSPAPGAPTAFNWHAKILTR